jgi:hypothetical protein
VTVADDALVAVPGLQIGMLAEKVRDFGLDRLGQQGTGPIAQDFGELIVEDSWLNQMDDVIVGHGISLLRWRSGGVKHPHDMPPSRFPPSPTFSDSSMSSNTMLYALYRMGYHGRATTHGFRAVASTILNESNLFNRDWIERQLAHVERNEVRRAYNAAEWMPDRRRMMQWWADHITAMALESNRIVPLLRAR